MLSTRDSLHTQVLNKLKMKGQEKIFPANGNQKKVEVAILISDKIDFKTKTVIKEGHYTLIKE